MSVHDQLDDARHALAVWEATALAAGPDDFTGDWRDESTGLVHAAGVNLGLSHPDPSAPTGMSTGAMVLGHGTPAPLVLAHLLACSPLRVRRLMRCLSRALEDAARTATDPLASLDARVTAQRATDLLGQAVLEAAGEW